MKITSVPVFEDGAVVAVVADDAVARGVVLREAEVRRRVLDAAEVGQDEVHGDLHPLRLGQRHEAPAK